jgi:hypothetical protein
MTDTVKTIKDEVDDLFVKELFVGVWEGAYGETLDAADETLFYSVKRGSPKYPGIWNILLSIDHPAYYKCMCMNKGEHNPKKCRKGRTYMINVNTCVTYQKCWAKQCSAKGHKGRMALFKAESEVEESDDEVPKYTTSTTLPEGLESKKRRRSN